MTDAWKQRRIEQDRRSLASKVTPAASRRMQRTAREQLADALAASRAPLELPAPDDADDASTQREVLQ